MAPKPGSQPQTCFWLTMLMLCVWHHALPSTSKHKGQHITEGKSTQQLPEPLILGIPSWHSAKELRKKGKGRVSSEYRKLGLCRPGKGALPQCPNYAFAARRRVGARAGQTGAGVWSTESS